MIAVSTPEEMPVNETLSLRDALLREQLDLDSVIVNAVYPSRFDSDQIARVERALQDSPSVLARGALRAALSEHARGETQRSQLARLRSGLSMDGRLLELPFVFSEELAQPQLESLADVLEAGLRSAGGSRR